jgi:hypothetical protein
MDACAYEAVVGAGWVGEGVKAYANMRKITYGEKSLCTEVYVSMFENISLVCCSNLSYFCFHPYIRQLALEIKILTTSHGYNVLSHVLLTVDRVWIGE